MDEESRCCENTFQAVKQEQCYANMWQAVRQMQQPSTLDEWIFQATKIDSKFIFHSDFVDYAVKKLIEQKFVFRLGEHCYYSNVVLSIIRNLIGDFLYCESKVFYLEDLIEEIQKTSNNYYIKFLEREIVMHALETKYTSLVALSDECYISSEFFEVCFKIAKDNLHLIKHPMRSWEFFLTITSRDDIWSDSVTMRNNSRNEPLQNAIFRLLANSDNDIIYPCGT